MSNNNTSIASEFHGLEHDDLLEYLKFYYVETQQSHEELSQAYEQLHQSSEINTLLAETLGACQHCFGESPDCKHCHGEGGPGWKVPQADLFHYLIIPAIERFKNETAKSV